MKNDKHYIIRYKQPREGYFFLSFFLSFFSPQGTKNVPLTKKQSKKNQGGTFADDIYNPKANLPLENMGITLGEGANAQYVQNLNEMKYYTKTY
jgi:hypothetical protein